jgi:hypothetical protein
MGDAPKKGPWHTYHAGWLALYGGVSLILLIAIAGTWASGGAAIPGLIGLFFFLMTGRQIQLMGQRG